VRPPVPRALPIEEKAMEFVPAADSTPVTSSSLESLRARLATAREQRGNCPPLADIVGRTRDPRVGVESGGEPSHPRAHAIAREQAAAPHGGAAAGAGRGRS